MLIFSVSFQFFSECAVGASTAPQVLSLHYNISFIAMVLEQDRYVVACLNPSPWGQRQEGLSVLLNEFQDSQENKIGS